jgi:hypothetical protein
MNIYQKGIALALCAIVGAIAEAATDQPTATPRAVTIEIGVTGEPIASDFIGLSFEGALLEPDTNGVHYFRADNRPLIELFRQLGVKSLRIGGNTSDRDAKRLPLESDLDRLFEFARAADVKVIFTLRFLNGDQADAAKTANYIMARYASLMDSFSIGQEPSAYPTQRVDTRPNLERMGATAEQFRYEDWSPEWERFAAAIRTAVPAVQFCGPAVHNRGDWAQKFMTEFGNSHQVKMCVMHLYPGGAGNKVPTPEIGRARMLSGEFLETYQKLESAFGPLARSKGLPYRLEETNNYYNGGASDVSDTFAAALWGLEYMHWWAARGARGVNFHTGDYVSTGSGLDPCKYTAFNSVPKGYRVRPLGYALKAFDIGGRGRVVPVRIFPQPDKALAAFATQADDQTIHVTLINKQHGPDGKEELVELRLPTGFRSGQTMFLSAPAADVAAKNMITLGGAEIGPAGTWAGAWTPTSLLSEKGVFTVRVPPATAAIVRLAR